MKKVILSFLVCSFLMLSSSAYSESCMVKSKSNEDMLYCSEQEVLKQKGIEKTHYNNLLSLLNLPETKLLLKNTESKWSGYVESQCKLTLLLPEGVSSGLYTHRFNQQACYLDLYERRIIELKSLIKDKKEFNKYK